MFEELRARYHALRRRLRRIERREARELRRWIEDTANLIHLSVLLFVPALIALVTWLSNRQAAISILIFPPLASGTYTLFSDPEGEYSSPRKFVGGLTLGAVCGVVALVVTAPHPPGQFTVEPSAAALGVAMTGATTWALNVEEPSAFSTALLALLLGTDGPVFVLGVAVSSSLVAGVFLLWRETFYEERAHYLYETTRADDHVLVPMRGEHANAVAHFAAELAAAHEAGKVVLLDVVADSAVARAEAEAVDHPGAEGRTVGVDGDGRWADEASDTTVAPGRDTATGDGADSAAAVESKVAADAVERLESTADEIETRIGVPCEVVVAAGGGTPARVAMQTARETNCDLVVTPFEERLGELSPFCRTLFGGTIDVVAFRSTGRTRWRTALVPVRKAGDTAHAMIDFATRVVGRSGLVGVATCITDDDHRRRAEDMLATLVETFDGTFETRVSRLDIAAFLSANDDQYDVVFVGASTDRSTASRFISPPTFERLRDIETDVAVVHRG